MFAVAWRIRDFLRPAIVAASAMACCAAASAQTVVNGLTIRSWGYQLQNDTATSLINSPYDVLVIDYSKSSGLFTQAELAAMKKKPDGSRRLVISYISIGEAESYRYYWGDRAWQDKRNRLPPVAAENPEWKGNFTVQFWEQEWQNLILFDRDSYINRIIDVGFDGIYLDKVDIVDDLKGKTPPGTEASDLMTQFIRKMSIVTKRRNPQFLIIAQNAEGLLDDDVYRSAIDGIGKESLLYSTGFFDEKNNYQTPKRNPDKFIQWSTERLAKLRNEGKLVMVVEYINERNLIERSLGELTKNGFIPYFGPRDLSYLSYTKETNNN
ncbi:MAG: endo alpha-1,4 polygalactosaminidase [Hyphomicrobiaceae bacterium]|nr:endo alpha-1,4 polygalactosaminidase [Hyphomicrobiaceae bacterium]